MLGMAVYAGVTGAVGAAGSTITEAESGWSRQLALTPLRPWQLTLSNMCNVALRAILPIAAVFIVGGADQGGDAAAPVAPRVHHLRTGVHPLRVLWDGLRDGGAGE